MYFHGAVFLLSVGATVSMIGTSFLWLWSVVDDTLLELTVFLLKVSFPFSVCRYRSLENRLFSFSPFFFLKKIQLSY